MRNVYGSQPGVVAWEDMICIRFVDIPGTLDPKGDDPVFLERFNETPGGIRVNWCDDDDDKPAGCFEQLHTKAGWWAMSIMRRHRMSHLQLPPSQEEWGR